MFHTKQKILDPYLECPDPKNPNPQTRKNSLKIQGPEPLTKKLLKLKTPQPQTLTHETLNPERETLSAPEAYVSLQP